MLEVEKQYLVKFNHISQNKGSMYSKIDFETLLCRNGHSK
jgi:hypothetical protein